MQKIFENLCIRRAIMRALKDAHREDILNIIRKGGNLDEEYDAVKEAIRYQKEELKFFKQYFRGWYD